MRESPLLELVRPYPALRAVLQRLEAADNIPSECGCPCRVCSPSPLNQRRLPLSQIRNYHESTPSKSPVRRELLRRSSPVCAQSDYRDPVNCFSASVHTTPAHVDYKAPMTRFSTSAHASPMEPEFVQYSPLGRSSPAIDMNRGYPTLNALLDVRASHVVQQASLNSAFIAHGVSSSHSSQCGTPRPNHQSVAGIAGNNLNNLHQCHTPRQVQWRLPSPPKGLVDDMSSPRRRDSFADESTKHVFTSGRRVDSKPYVSNTYKRARSLSLQASEPYEDRWVADIKSWPVSNSFLYGKHGELMGARLGIDRPETPRNRASARPPSGHQCEIRQRRSRSLQASEPFTERCGSPSTNARFVLSLRDGSETPRTRTGSNSASPASSARAIKVVRPSAHIAACDSFSGNLPRVPMHRPNELPARRALGVKDEDDCHEVVGSYSARKAQPTIHHERLYQ